MGLLLLFPSAGGFSGTITPAAETDTALPLGYQTIVPPFVSVPARPSGRLAVTVTHANGNTSRWGPDEFDPVNHPAGLGFSTQMPGGFGTCTLTLPRRIDVEWPDLNLLDTVTVYGAGGQVAFEGRVTQLPRVHADTFSIQIGAVGWSAHLKDNPFFREVYVDRDLSHWQDMPYLNEKVRLAAAAADFDILKWQNDDGWTCALPNQALPAKANAQLWYRLPAGLAISKIQYQGKESLTFTGLDNRVFCVSVGDQFDGTEIPTPTNDDTIRTMSLTSRQRYVAAHVTVAAGGAGTPTSGQYIGYKKLAVHGNHGLTSVVVTGAMDGYYVSDMVADIVTRAAPLLNFTTGTDGTIAQTTFVVEQSEFRDPVTPEEAILKLNGYHLWDWAVWEDRTFHYKPTNPDALCWEARLSDGAQLDLEGAQADTLYNGVIVTYTTPDGQTRTVGPTGSGADDTSAYLIDTNATNPATAAGITAKWGELSISGATTLAGATQLGQVWLAERSLPQRRGTLKVTGHIQHPTKGWRPTWEPRAGDYVRISDHPNDVKRRIIETAYSHDSREVTMSLDNSVWKLTAMIDRLGVIPG